MPVPPYIVSLMTTTTARRKTSPASRKAAAEKAAAERTALLDQLAAFQDDLDEDSVAVARIAVWSQKYSDNNAVLIVMQAPEATDIRGYRQWQAEGRQVRKGEHGIRILAPAGQAPGTEGTPATETTPAEDGKPGRRFFKLISVFDFSQTEAITDRTPNYGCGGLEGMGSEAVQTVGELLGSDA